MAYSAHLGANQHLGIENRNGLTLITLTTHSPGQQQSQSNSFATGNWTATPQLFNTSSGFILQIEGEQGRYLIQLQANSLKILTTTPGLDPAQAIQLHKHNVSTATSQSKIEFEPMQPLKMGDMSMSMQPMTMKMGKMSMQMGTEMPATSSKRFCTQCGQSVNQSDRFCGSCGHQLDSN